MRVAIGAIGRVRSPNVSDWGGFMFGRKRIGPSIVAGLLASSITIGGGMAALAQDGTPEATPAEAVEEEAPPPLQSTFTLIGTDGNAAGFGSIVETDDGSLEIKLANSGNSGLAPGEHGIHLHQAGVCTATGGEPFATAGGHFNPTDMAHGAPDADPHHAGDLGNLTVEDDGSFVFEITVQGEGLTLDPEIDPSLADEDGTAILIHQNPDDLKTDPSGNSGARVACGLVVQSTVPGATPIATPVGSPEASPVATPVS